MKRYWFEFNFSESEEIPFGLLLGCGITAFSYDDAIAILKEKVFSKRQVPVISKKIENVDIRTLDQDNVIPNMKPPNVRGVWFPAGFD